MSDHQSRLYSDRPPAAHQLVVNREAVPAQTPADDAVAARAELIAEAAEPELYRAFLSRRIPAAGFMLVERNGTMHGFKYHTIRHPKHQRGRDGELLSFTADGLAIVMEEHGLDLIFRALIRHTLTEAREYDGRQRIEDDSARVTRLEVTEPTAVAAPRAHSA